MFISLLTDLTLSSTVRGIYYQCSKSNNRYFQNCTFSVVLDTLKQFVQLVAFCLKVADHNLRCLCSKFLYSEPYSVPSTLMAVLWGQRKTHLQDISEGLFSHCVYLRVAGFYVQPDVLFLSEQPVSRQVARGSNFSLSCGVQLRGLSEEEGGLYVPVVWWSFNNTRTSEVRGMQRGRERKREIKRVYLENNQKEVSSILMGNTQLGIE